MNEREGEMEKGMWELRKEGDDLRRAPGGNVTHHKEGFP